MSGVESRLDKVNKNLKDIKKDTKKLKEIFTEEYDMVDASPEDVGWGDVVNKYDELTADGQIPASQLEFEGNVANKDDFIANQILGLFPSGGGCSPYSFSFKGTNITLGDCQTFSNIRLILEWVLVLAAVYRVYAMVLMLKPNGGN
jgi:hypothetical protein